MEKNIMNDSCLIINLNHLNLINLAKNQIKNLDCLFESNESNWNEVYYLFLSYNRITSINSLQYFQNLTRLFLDHNQIEELRPLSNILHLKHLQLSSNRIKNIEWLENMTNLFRLYLSENEIEDICWIRNLTELRILELTKNRIRFIPNGLFDNFKFLFDLKLGFNYIKKLDSFGAFVENKLKIFDLSHNQIENDTFLRNFSSLTELKLNNNSIKNVNLIDLNKINDIRTIDLSFNKIQLNQMREFFKIGPNLTTILIDLNLIELFDKVENERCIKQNEFIKFYKSLFIVTKNQLDFVDCQLQLKYLKKMILLNLFYSFQIQNFLSNCKLL